MQIISDILAAGQSVNVAGIAGTEVKTKHGQFSTLFMAKGHRSDVMVQVHALSHATKLGTDH